ncbi:MAG: ATP-binding protein [Candidatus Lokiarchaeota archaeon]|nr:ATP-binding protein [Candidatus Lokiarchaeota archaeon]
MTVPKEQPVGRIKGPGETTYEFTFITSCKDKVKISEYLYYTWKDGAGVERKVVARVTGVEQIRMYPDPMLANPAIDPAAVAGVIDYSPQGMDLYQVTAQVVGYFKDQAFKFVNPRVSPTPGSAIYLATKQDLSEWLSSKKVNEPGGAFIGTLLNRPGEDIPVVLDVKAFVSTHLAVLAATGQGKSYTVGDIIEEMMGPRNKAAVLVLDPHDEYGTMKEVESRPEFSGKSYTPVVKLFRPDDIRVRFSELAISELLHILQGISDKMTSVLREAIHAARKVTPNFTVQDVLNALSKLKTGGNESSVEGVIWRIHEFIMSRALIDDAKHIHLQDVLRPGQLSIFNLSQIEEDDQQVIVSVFLHRILRSRITAMRKGAKPSDMDALDYPVFIVLEEGHRFAPASDESRSKRILKTILSEGRKFGVGVCIVSQRPGKLDSDVLSQCMTQIIMKMINPVDQQNIKNSVEGISADLIEELPGLTRGQAVVIGEAINTPVLIQIRSRQTKHGGSSIDAVKEWEDKWAPARQIDVEHYKDDEPLK